jgi:Pyruvate/2-oxoacid:ferredoxin oxidoreductase delta subunit
MSSSVRYYLVKRATQKSELYVNCRILVVVCTENLVHLAKVAEAHSVALNECAALFRPGHLDLAIQVEEPT